ncbi:hypothetical protein DFH07DRAFT_109042 [Mycena maculata]|uniref:Uncharacterized protein n=1 Tax=Mycena maculata TaxID=230809 RepID=A0AAD7I718_9AGAR|nr:hypothetical protein DFH07DRAFT_109042 [Mycena maculata]
MANNLPDEIVSEILSPALKVSDDAFSDTSGSNSSPFASYSESSSAFLLVSKAWLRVATPLLYHVVVLRSKAQASALDTALRENPELGRFIKKLRVEGGYGACMHKIIKSAPNVTDLFVDLSVWSSDNVAGLVRGLPLMNPTRVVLSQDRFAKRNKNSQLLLDTLAQCLKQWPNLTVCEFPFQAGASSTTLASALKEAPNLKTAIISTSTLWDFPQYLRLMAQNTSLQNIRLKGSSMGYSTAAPLYAHVISSDPELSRVLEIPENHATSYTDPPSFPIPPSKALQFSTASVTEDVWKRILSFVAVLEPDAPDSRMHPRLGIVLVSKMFARLALPYFYEAVIFRIPLEFIDFSARVDTMPSLRSHVSTLYFATAGSINLRPILPKIALVNIIGTTPFNMTYKSFSDVGKHSGSSIVRLEGLVIPKGSALQNPSTLSLFPNLRSLSVAIKAIFDVNSAFIPAGALPNLEELSFTAVDGSFLTVLSQMNLPSLRTAKFELHNANIAPFLAKHGGKLRTLSVNWMTFDTTNVFNLCPAMVALTVHCGTLVPNCTRFTSSGDHTCLETISLQTNDYIRGGERKWGPFFKALRVDTFPALQRISLPCIRWPTTEHDIGKSSWVRAAEALLDRDVRLTDNNGGAWRRRLKK